METKNPNTPKMSQNAKIFSICDRTFLPVERYCGGQLYPVLKPRWKRPSPTSDLINMGCVKGARPNVLFEGERVSEDDQQRKK